MLERMSSSGRYGSYNREARGWCGHGISTRQPSTYPSPGQPTPLRCEHPHQVAEAGEEDEDGTPVPVQRGGLCIPDASVDSPDGSAYQDAVSPLARQGRHIWARATVMTRAGCRQMQSAISQPHTGVNSWHGWSIRAWIDTVCSAYQDAVSPLALR